MVKSIKNSVIKFYFRLDDNLKNLDRYETWQQKADDIKAKLDETKDNLDAFDTPTSDVAEREKQKRFLNVRYSIKGCQNIPNCLKLAC